MLLINQTKPYRHNPTSGLVSTTSQYPPHLTQVAKPLSVMEVEKDADENFRHKSAALLHQATSLGHTGVGPLDDWGVLKAEERLAEANRRIRLLQGEAAQLDAMRQQQLMSGEEEILGVKRKLLDDWEAREREWERRKENELRSMKVQESILHEREQHLIALEERAEAQLLQAEEDFALRRRELEDENSRFIVNTETRLREELRREMEPAMRSDLTIQLTSKVTNEIREELQHEFMRMCEAMREEVDAARARLRVEMEQELTPVIEQRLFLELKTRAEQDVHATVLGQLRDANHATQLLRDELTQALDQRDRSQAETASLRQEVVGLQAQNRKFASEIANLQASAKDYNKLQQQLVTLEAEHALLQQAAAGVLQQAGRSSRPQASPEHKNVSPRRGAGRGGGGASVTHPTPMLHSLADLSAMIDRGSKHPESRTPTMQVWPPRLLPNGGVVC